MQLVLLSYNNYANRILKKEDTVSDYYQSAKSFYIIQDYDFNPADGVDTRVTLGGEYYDYNAVHDYLLVCDGNDIVSRWFIMDADRTRTGQYVINLHRDVLADSWAFLHDAPAFIEKGYLNANDPAIFNSENMGFNQIKTDETLLKSSMDMPWIVGFYPRDNEQHTGTTVNISTRADIDLSNTDFNDWEYTKYQNEDFYGEITNFLLRTDFKTTAVALAKTRSFSDSTSWGGWDQSLGVNNFVKLSYLDETQKINALRDSANRIYIPNAEKYAEATYGVGGRPSSASVSYFAGLDGKVIVFSGATYYRVHVIVGSTKKFSNDYVAVASVSDLFGMLAADTEYVRNYESINGTPFYINTEHTTYRLEFEIVPASDPYYKWEIGATRNHLSDAPYDAFAIPYGNYAYFGSTWKMSREQALNVATSIAKELGTVYDMQLLPYSPDEVFELHSYWSADANCYNYIKDSADNNAGVMFHLSKSSFTKKISVQIEVPEDALEKKVMNECEVYRICSPNYNGVFEFSPAKNGSVPYFTVSATYLPYKSYIKVAPYFKGLYGKDFGDNRGLLIGGDFSLAIVNDQWQQYQVNNKNFENIFNRQIENLEFNNSEAMKMARFNAVTGAIGGTVNGAAGGSVVGGAIGAGVGAVAGLTAGAVGGALDIRRLQRQQSEAMDYTRDMFGYNLGNIKARPDCLSKTTAYCIDNKYFPFLERYTCTEVEKEALRNKVKYNGMSIYRVGTIDEFNKKEYNYIKGQFIRVDGMSEDFHFINTIRDEFNKGVYIK